MSQKTFGAYQLNSSVLNLIWLERLRQQQLLREGKFTFNCATAEILPDKKLRVCTEELGEVAEAIDALESAKAHQKKAARAHLREEVTQLAACAIAWLESLQEEKS